MPRCFIPVALHSVKEVKLDGRKIVDAFTGMSLVWGSQDQIDSLQEVVDAHNANLLVNMDDADYNKALFGGQSL